MVGDGTSDLGRLAGRRFDAIVDTCGYVPVDVGASVDALASADCYCFVSSISAYDSFAHAPVDEPLQFIDVRDLGEWIVRLLERGGRGAFNATGPVGRPPYTWPELVEACVGAASAHGAAAVEVVRIGEQALLDAGVTPWSELPLWLPSIDADYHGHSRVDTARAFATGLATRPIAATIAAVIAEGLPAADDERRRGRLTREREAGLVAQERA